MILQRGAKIVFFTFLPWIIFWVLLGLHESKSAAIFAALAMSSVVIVTVLGKKSIKLLQITSLVFFLSVTAIALIIDLNRYWLIVRVSGSALLSLVVFLSILLGKPFTIQYAREKSPKELWQNPTFIHINYVLSWVWLGILLSQLIVPLLKLSGFNLPKIAGPFVAISGLIAGLRFTTSYAKKHSLSLI